MYSFIETKLFTRLVQHYLTDDEYAALQAFMAAEPEVGRVIPGSGGVRKLRWRAAGRGKRGGNRVIYCIRHSERVFWMLTMYPRNIKGNVSPRVLRQIRQEMEND